MGCTLVAAALVASCVHPWTVVEQASPNPLAGVKQFAVLPMDFEGVRIGGLSEERYLADEKKKPEDLAKAKENLTEAKAEIGAAFRESIGAATMPARIQLTHGPPGQTSTFVVRPRVRAMDPGFFAVVASGPSKMIVDLTVEDASGRVLDRIALDHGTSPTTWEKIEAPARWREDAAWIGKTAGEYLVHRVSGGD